MVMGSGRKLRKPVCVRLLFLAGAIFGATLVQQAPARADYQAGVTAYQGGDFRGAYEQWLPLAQQGDAAAQNALGALYDHGLGMGKDPVTAAYWYEQSAKQGFPLAMRNLGTLYANGNGVPRDLDQARAWLLKAADAGDTEAVQRLSVLMTQMPQQPPSGSATDFLMNTPKTGAADPGSVAFDNGDFTGAMDAWKPKAEGGDPEAMTNIGVLYNLGLGVKRDDQEAAAWYGKAAQLGFALAQFDLANLYYDGQGVDRDRKQAARWYTAAAKGGHPKAQLYLAQMYENGEGVDEDQAAALTWYQKAADQGLPEAQYTLGKKLVYGDGVGADGRKGTDLLLKAADQHYAKAQILIADCYWRARGVPQNLIEAYVWAAQAVENPRAGQDAKRAASLYDDIKSGMTDGQIKAAEIELQAVAPKPRDRNKSKSSGQDSGSDDGIAR